MSLLDRSAGSPGPTLTDRYLDAVGRQVPHDKRDEVCAQLRESLDIDVNRRVASGIPVLEAERQALEALGDPRRVADDAVGPRWLVGPRVYPDYLRVLRTVAAIALPIIAAAVAITSGLAGQNPVEVVLSAGAAVFAAAVHIAFWVTVAFVVVERTGTPAPSQGRRWTVADLPAPERARVGVGETATGIVFSVLLIGVVLWPWTYVPSAGAEPVPVLSGDLRPGVTAFLVAVLAAGIVLDLVCYLRGRWTMLLAALNTLLDVAFAGIVIGLVASERLFDPAFVEALRVSPTLDPAQVDTVVSAMGTGIAWGVGLVCAADAISGWVRAAHARRG